MEAYTLVAVIIVLTQNMRKYSVRVFPNKSCFLVSQETEINPVFCRVN